MKQTKNRHIPTICFQNVLEENMDQVVPSRASVGLQGLRVAIILLDHVLASLDISEIFAANVSCYYVIKLTFYRVV
jgi:hypothetical protein